MSASMLDKYWRDAANRTVDDRIADFGRGFSGRSVSLSMPLQFQDFLAMAYRLGRVEVKTDPRSDEARVYLGMERVLHLPLVADDPDMVNMLARRIKGAVGMRIRVALDHSIRLWVFCSPCLIHRDRGEGLDPADVCASNPLLGLACARGR